MTVIASSGFGVANAASRLESDSARLAGAFVDWGSVGREHTLQAWEKSLKQEPSSVLGVDFYGQSSWEDFNRFSWVPGIWKKLNPAECRLVSSVDRDRYASRRCRQRVARCRL
jgi:hypothetical protein